MKEIIINDGYTAIVNGVEMDTNSKEYVNYVVDLEKDRCIKEAVNHFLNGSRARNYNSEEEARYFFSKKDLDAFVDLFNHRHGNWEKMKCQVILDDCNEFFCYELCRISCKEMR